MDDLDWMQRSCFVVATVHWAMAVYGSAGDPFAVVVLVGYYLMLLLTLYCNYAANRTPPGSKRRRLKTAVKVLSSILIFMTSVKVAASISFIMLPWAAAFTYAAGAAPAAVLLWAAFSGRQVA